MSAFEAETPDGPIEIINVLFALHPDFGAQELVGPLKVLTNALHKTNDDAWWHPLRARLEDLDEYHVLVASGGVGGLGIKQLLAKQAKPYNLIKASAELQQKDLSEERTLLAVGTRSLLLAHAGLLQVLSATARLVYCTKMEIICKEAARRGDLEQTDMMEENYDVNNARFSLSKNPEENPFILTKRPGGRRKSIARKDGNAWKDSVMGTARLTYSYIEREIHTEGHTHGATYAWGNMHTKETYARRCIHME
ncbi:hypothetical protein MMC31_001186 [Peltigera leucophlebia]|nr:hypothetical protein [Peltigera leucophlebia]